MHVHAPFLFGSINPLLNLMPSQLSVATKVNPWGSGLTRTSVLEQVATCLNSLQTECVDLLYLHAPDHNTPVEETLGAIQEVYQGLSGLQTHTIHR